MGHGKSEKLFTENDWTNLNWRNLHPYHKSKTLAEETAWKFMKENPGLSIFVMLNSKFKLKI